MAKYISISIEDLDKLDGQYAIINNRRPTNLLNYVGTNEEIYFCYYSIVKGTKIFFQRYEDLSICVLTGTRLIYSMYDLSSQIKEVLLSQILELDSGFGNISVKYSLNSYRIRNETSIDREYSSFFIFLDNKDIELATKISRDIREAMSNLNKPTHSRTSNVDYEQSTKNNTITNQLEKLAELYKTGVLTDEEFKNAKKKILQN
jgi:hypothetical protein